MSIAITEKQKEVLIRLRQELRLDGFASELENQYENLSIYAGLTFEERLISCIEKQEQADKERKCANLIKRAKLKDHLRLSDLTKTSQYGLSKETLASLCCRRLRLSVFLMPILSFFNDFSLQYCTQLLTPNLSIEVAPIVHC